MSRCRTPRPNTRRGAAAFRRFWPRPLGLAPATEDQAAEGEAEPEGAESEAADGERFPPGGQALPAAEGLPLFLGQGLAAPLLAHCTTCAEAQVEIVEDLGGLVRHGLSL